MVRGISSVGPADPGVADVARYGRRKGRRGPTDGDPTATSPDHGPAPLCPTRRERPACASSSPMTTACSRRASPPWPAGWPPSSTAGTSCSWWPRWSTTAGPERPSGPVYERESIPYETVEIPGLADVPTFGIEGPPALAVILACIEGFGPRPDMVVSGINHGVNAGRSALHSGTVGATLTAAQFGVRGLAVSIAWGEDPVPWETPVSLAAGIVPALEAMPPADRFSTSTCPRWHPHLLRGLRHGSLGTVGPHPVRPSRAHRPPGGRHAGRSDLRGHRPRPPGHGGGVGPARRARRVGTRLGRRPGGRGMGDPHAPARGARRRSRSRAAPATRRGPGHLPCRTPGA